MKKHILMNEAGADGADAGGGSATPAAAAAAPAAQPDKSMLSAAAGVADAPKPINELIPEKFRVSKDGGEFDIEASARKLADAHANLEKRLGSGDAPPKTPEEYKIEGLPDHIDIEKLKADESFQGFLKGAHAKGMTNAQVQWALAEHARILGDMPTGQYSYEQAQAELSKAWKPEEFDGNLKAAFQAASGLAQRAGLTTAEMEAAGLSNNPVFFRMLAALGPSMKEDSPPNSFDTTQPEQIEIAQARRQLSSMSEKDPGYNALRQKVDAFYKKQYGTAAVT